MDSIVIGDEKVLNPKEALSDLNFDIIRKERDSGRRNEKG